MTDNGDLEDCLAMPIEVVAIDGGITFSNQEMQKDEWLPIPDEEVK